ncbi:MAG TPA: hypothetical protein VHN55_04915 [Sphingomicrobium sp.]|nr:hypothetical protein [Sphingomicrobium sp.]
MRNWLAAAALVALAGCDNSVPTGNEPNGPIITVEPDDNGAADGAPADAAGAGELPAAGPIPRFVGKWAADEKSCQSLAWQFTATTLRTPAGSSCSFNRISEVPGGYDVDATCTAEGPPTDDVLEIRFAESAKAMLFESETVADSGLVFCGRDV